MISPAEELPGAAGFVAYREEGYGDCGQVGHLAERPPGGGWTG